MSTNRRSNEMRATALRVGAVALVIIFLISLLMLMANLFEKHNSQYDGDGVILEETVIHNGKKFVLNDNVETILMLGLDKFDGDKNESYNNDKQADFLMLFVLDHKEQTCRAIHLNRDAMVEMNILGVAGDKVGSVTKQLALAHTYGNGKEVSCRNTANAVSKMLMGVEIDHYVSVTMDAVSTYNDFIGGVTLEVMDDFTGIDDSLVKGEVVSLTGEQALVYVRSRYGLDDPTNNSRMKRQKQYLETLYEKTHQLISEDETFISQAALTVADYLVSDCSGNKLEDLLKRISNYELNTIIDIPGKTVMGEKFLEFYPDKGSINEIVIESFYKMEE